MLTTSATSYTAQPTSSTPMLLLTSTTKAFFNPATVKFNEGELIEFDDHVLRFVLADGSDLFGNDPMDDDAIEVAIQRYKIFLLQRKRHPEDRLVPPLDIDRVWHAHILQTAQYRQDCQRYLGWFLNHASRMCNGGGCD